ncbi:MAG: hypothetical protein OEY52_16685 [Gammaproteobacteria bacterium]|nr:hypothetical protein [Gammaproteobacteria bacterium]
MLNTLQQHLEQVYEVDTNLQVSEFLITDPILADKYDTSENPRNVHEKLLLAQNDDQLDVALFLSKEIIGHLEANNPLESLNEENLHQFWVALEGISHFTYLTWNAQYDRQISLFELELQAEVDKFVMAIWLFSRQQDMLHPKHLITKLFIKLQFDSALTEHELNRYTLANQYAYRYCEKLMGLLAGQFNEQQLFNDIRRFYRLTNHYKLRHICNS